MEEKQIIVFLPEASWEDRYNHIVWVKSYKYPWWPAKILHPKLLPENLQETAFNYARRKYAVLYYNDPNPYGFVELRNIRPFLEYEHEYLNQVIKRVEYSSLFPAACRKAKKEYQKYLDNHQENSSQVILSSENVYLKH
jgi:hypothetical protein